MGFVVTRPGGTRDAEFETYSRLLRWGGKNLADSPRVPDPENPNRRWAYVWNDSAEAQKFAEQMNTQTGQTYWHVQPTAAPPSDGPFGPDLIQLVRRSDGLAFSLHPLSRTMIRDGFPGATPSATNSFIGIQAWTDFQKTHGGLGDLVQEILPPLTGLDMARLTQLGYAVIDADDAGTRVYVAPETLNAA